MPSRSLPGPLVLPGAVLGVALALAGCASPPAPAPPPLGDDDSVRAAQQLLTDRCLVRQGLTPPRPGQPPRGKQEQREVAAALFGAGEAELTEELPTGYVVRAHTDGCLAGAQRALYGDQERWFRASTVVNNLKAIAAYEDRSLAAVRADHRADVTAHDRLRAHAVERATTLLDKEKSPS
ncbi:hypothetical protein [Streptomyces sp. WAC 06738]|uniref:hypothetical protein n=1 Tax=Streptomyces sp. WAC 06738 TaxID=2203210 RepID=UPI0013E07425|nr:hypothetical protein [Streptomyces sp. WAC 06738]